MNQVNDQFGRRPLKHSQNKVIGHTRSIQGGWKNDDMHSNYPKHLLEHQNKPDLYYVEPRPLKEVENRGIQEDYYTKWLRSKPRVAPYLERYAPWN